MASGRIPDQQISASSYLDYAFPYNARLGGSNFWCSKEKKSGKDEYIQIDLGEVSGSHDVIDSTSLYFTSL